MTLARVHRWLLLAPALLPVIIWGSVIYPYLVPKTLLFYALSLATFAVFLVRVARGDAFRWGRLARPLNWIPAALLILAVAASYVGIGFYHSVWSYFIRGDGLLMLAGVVLAFYQIMLVADEAFAAQFFALVASVASAVAVYGIGEWLVAGGRIESLLGNAAFFAGYLGVALFATLLAAESQTGVWRTLLRIGAALEVVAITLTATRGTMLALGLALIAVLVVRTFRRGGKMRSAAALALAALVVAGGLFVAFRSELAKAPFSPVARIASIGLSDPDVASRLFIWKNMLGQIAAHPWLGVGAEHIDALFNRFYDPTQIQEEWFDRSHNAFLDYAAQYGVGGLALYLGLIGGFLVAARRMRARGESRIAGIFALLALVYAVQNFFVFDTISSFWLFLALLAIALTLSDAPVAPEMLPLPRATRIGLWPAAAILVALIVPVAITPARAAYDLAQAYLYQITDVPQSVAYLSHGYALGTYADLEYGYLAFDMYVHNQAAALSGDARAAAYQTAVSLLRQNFDRYPYDARTALYLAQTLSLAPPTVMVDSALLSATLARSIEESPKRAQAWYLLANISISQANAYPIGSTGRIAGYTAARDILGKFIQLVPNLAEPHFVLAELLFAEGDRAGAAAEAALGKSAYAGDLETARRAVSYYENALDLPDAAFFLREVLRKDPGNAAAAKDLAQIEAYESR